jgi:putative oxidoreductase
MEKEQGMTTLLGYSDSRSIGAAADMRARDRARTIVLWILQFASAGLFLLGGFSKLLGAAAMVQMFDAIGIGQWFRYLTGGIEVVSGLLLLVPSLAFFGAAALAITMAGAIVTHLFVIGGSPVPAVVLLAATTAVAWLRYPARAL